MAKRGRKPIERKEISKEIGQTKNGYCDSSVYGKKVADKLYVFTDIRTLVNCDNLKNFDKEHNCFSSAPCPLERLVHYKLMDKEVGFDLDYCSSCRKTYKFKVMEDLYEVLWGREKRDGLSAETLVSAGAAILRRYRDMNKEKGNPPSPKWKEFLEYCEKNELEQKELCVFAYAIATLGNFMPVPGTHQSLLSVMGERYDRVLHLIKAYFYVPVLNISNNFFPESIQKWLGSFSSWENFVKQNYLLGSFVGSAYNVIEYDGTLKQLSEMIYKRSIVMIQEYDKRINQI